MENPSPPKDSQPATSPPTSARTKGGDAWLRGSWRPRLDSLPASVRRTANVALFATAYLAVVLLVLLDLGVLLGVIHR